MTVWAKRLKQIGVVLLGLMLAAVMVGLGVWQLSVYHAQGREQAVKRAAQPAVAVRAVAPPGQQVTDEGYGRTVRFTGSYDVSMQTFIAVGGQPGRYRVLTGFRLSDGGVLPVVRGLVTGKEAPAPPRGNVTATGVLLPSEGTGEQSDPSAEPTTVALAALVQKWDGPLVNGYATLNASEAREQSLQPAEVALPSSHGRLRNGFYALQWWVFAAFAILMGVRMARDIGRAGEGEAAVIGSVQGTDTAPGSDAPAPPEKQAGSDETAGLRP